MAGLSVDLVSSDRKVWSGTAQSVSAPSVNGDIGVMAGHTPLLAVLKPGTVHVVASDGSDLKAEVNGGFMSVDNNLVTVVADEITQV